MFNTDICQSLNKGVPCTLPISIDPTDLIQLSDNPELTHNILYKNFDKFIDELEKETNVNLLLQYAVVIDIEIDPKTLERHLVYSLESILTTLAVYLGIINEFTVKQLIGVDIILEKIKEKTRELKTICNEKKLNKKFPLLATKREEYIELLEKFREIKKSCSSDYYFNRYLIDSTEGKYNIEKYKELEQMKTIDGFIRKFSKMFDTLLNNFDKLYDIFSKKPLDAANLGIEPWKLELYLANRYMIFAELSKQDMQQELLYYVSSYLLNTKENKRFTLNGVEISRDDLYQRYIDLMVLNPDLRFVNFEFEKFKDMSLTELRNFMNSYFEDLKANWDFLGSNENFSDKDFTDKLAVYINKKKISEEEKEELKIRMMELYSKKKEFFDLSEPVYRIKGKNTFDGYIGYIYKNGKVVLEKFFDNIEKGRLTHSNAIYVMNVNEFLSISQLGKTKIISDKLCKRFIHKGDWQSKVAEEINTLSDENVSSEVQLLLLKGVVSYD